MFAVSRRWGSVGTPRPGAGPPPEGHTGNVNVAGVGTVRGDIRWDELQKDDGYSVVAAQLQSGRGNDLLGVAFAAQSDNPIRYPGFTRSGDLGPLPAPGRVLIRVAARLFGRPINESISPIHALLRQSAGQCELDISGAQPV